MNQSQLIKEIAEKTQINENAVKEMLQALQKIVYKEIKKDGSITLEKLGKFYSKDYKARKITTPQGIEMQKEACKSPKFRPSKLFKDYINHS